MWDGLSVSKRWLMWRELVTCVKFVVKFFKQTRCHHPSTGSLSKEKGCHRHHVQNKRTGFRAFISDWSPLCGLTLRPRRNPDCMRLCTGKWRQCDEEIGRSGWKGFIVWSGRTPQVGQEVSKTKKEEKIPVPVLPRCLCKFGKLAQTRGSLPYSWQQAKEIERLYLYQLLTEL